MRDVVNAIPYKISKILYVKNKARLVKEGGPTYVGGRIGSKL
jgi:hypothetical protein